MTEPPRRKRPAPLGRLRRTFHSAGLLPRSRSLRDLTKLAEVLPTRGNLVRVIHDGDELFDAMLKDIASARLRISMEMYWFDHDAVGREFANALTERAVAGVRVRIVYDAVGSLSTSAEFFRQLQRAGIEVLEYHPVKPWQKRFALFRRNHRKTIIIDGKIGYAGGANIGLLWAGARRGGGGWRDTHTRVEGPAAGDLEVLFQETWFRQTGELLKLPREVPREPPRDSEAGMAAPSGAQVAVVSSAGARRRRIRTLYLRALRDARHKINITVSYFMPDRAFRTALGRAARRGVKVQLLLPLRSDVQWVEWVGRAFYAQLLKRGVEIFQYRPGILHAKIVVIDGGWSMLGSSNLDHFSFNLNLEANLIVFDKEIGKSLEEQFVHDTEAAHKLTLETWEQRPFWERGKELIAILLRPWL